MVEHKKIVDKKVKSCSWCAKLGTLSMDSSCKKRSMSALDTHVVVEGWGHTSGSDLVVHVWSSRLIFTVIHTEGVYLVVSKPSWCNDV